jgi:hypothetical protein
MVNEWPAFVQGAPNDWKKDRFITSRNWVSIAAGYGQNLPLAGANDEIGLRADREVWRQSRNYRTEVRYLNFATATHFE